MMLIKPRKKTFFQDQYRLLYLALKDAFYGQKKCLKTEKFLSDYQEQTCYANCGDIAQKTSYSSDMEVYLNFVFF